MHDRICIIGAGGMLGTELVRACKNRLQSHELHALTHSTLDITDALAVDEVIGQMAPCVVLNAAAYTDVDGCEKNRELAWAVNSHGPANLARSCEKHQCRLVHVSTDFVFDGRKSSPYLPDDPVNPLSAYGQSKAEGEAAVREILKDHAIVRTSWLYAAHGKNFIRTILRLAEERDELQVVDDQIGSPTYAADLADALAGIAASNVTGTCHFCNSGSCSWHEFATEICRQSGKTIPVHPMSTRLLSRPAQRPAYSVLNTTTFTATTGDPPRQWQHALQECLAIGDFAQVACPPQA